MSKKKNKVIRYLLIIAVALMVVAIVGKKSGWLGGDGAIQVATEKVQKRNIIETVPASGKIQPEMEVKISPDVSGEIIGLYVKEGDKVKKGQLLVKIRPDIYESYLDRANATLNNAKADLANMQARLVQVEAEFSRIKASFERSKKLHKDKVISDSEYETALSSYESTKANVEAARQSVIGARFNIASAEAGVKEARDNMVKTTILSPVDGTVSQLNVETGERVVGTSQMAGTEMMRIANLSSMEVSVDVNENDINRLTLGDTAIIEVDAFINKKFKGVVTEIANSANIVGTSADQVTNFPVKIRILPESYSNTMQDTTMPSPFRPGLSATVEIQTKKVMNILTIPIQAVTTRSDSVNVKGKTSATKTVSNNSVEEGSKLDDVIKECVFVYESGKVRMVEVTTGIQDNTYIEITSGLKGTEDVVIAPYLAVSKRLKDGTVVKKVSQEELFKTEKK